MIDIEQIHHATVFDDATRHVARIYAEALLGAADKRQQTQEVLEQLEERRVPAIFATFLFRLVYTRPARSGLAVQRCLASAWCG